MTLWYIYILLLINVLCTHRTDSHEIRTQVVGLNEWVPAPASHSLSILVGSDAGGGHG